jgi:hypothetical protein
MPGRYLPRQTQNCVLLYGALGAMAVHDKTYFVKELTPTCLILEHRVTGNEYEVTVKQISGEE